MNSDEGSVSGGLRVGVRGEWGAVQNDMLGVILW